MYTHVYTYTYIWIKTTISYTVSLTQINPYLAILGIEVSQRFLIQMRPG